MINSRKFPQAHNHDAMRKFSSLLVGVHWGLLNAVISVWHSSRDAIKTELPYEPRAAAPKQLCRVRTEMRTTAIHSPSIWEAKRLWRRTAETLLPFHLKRAKRRILGAGGQCGSPNFCPIPVHCPHFALHLSNFCPTPVLFLSLDQFLTHFCPCLSWSCPVLVHICPILSNFCTILDPVSNQKPRKIIGQK